MFSVKARITLIFSISFSPFYQHHKPNTSGSNWKTIAESLWKGCGVKLPATNWQRSGSSVSAAVPTDSHLCLPGLIFTMNGDDRRSEPVVEYQQQSVCTASAVNLLKVRQSLQADHTESGWLSDQLHHHRGIEKEKDHMLMMTIGPQRLCIVWGGLSVQPTPAGIVD